MPLDNAWIADSIEDVLAVAVNSPRCCLQERHRHHFPYQSRPWESHWFSENILYISKYLCVITSEWTSTHPENSAYITNIEILPISHLENCVEHLA